MALPTEAQETLTEYRRKRDFSKTEEPSGKTASARSSAGRQRAQTWKVADAGRGTDAPALRFVVQKHAASHLHFDFRLELDGVMKSWAVPKGPSLDPSVKRLAMEVEDHPIEYNTFEGTIPKGQYGGGTVMLWDRGTYAAATPNAAGDDQAVLRRGYEAGKLDFILEGERLHGGFALVRTRGGNRSKPQWLLIKHRDEHAEPGSDIVAAVTTSVATGRTMEEIERGAGRGVRGAKARAQETGGRTRLRGVSPSRRAVTHPSARRTGAPARSPHFEPMYATIGSEIPTQDGWVFEPKYDGIRVLAVATPESVRLVTRNGKDKAAQFPEIVPPLRKLAAQRRGTLVLDGEIVGLVKSVPARFQQLQSRMHVKDAAAIAAHAREMPAALIVFDILLDGCDNLLHEPWSSRRRRLEQRLRNRTSARVRLGDSVSGDGQAMVARARAGGWEGIIAKRMDAPYEPGARSRAWLKLKVEHRQEFVIGGYTEPRNTREHIGALLLGYFQDGRFVYAGHTGGGFTRAALAEMHHRLKPLERATSPFTPPPKTNERAHWVRPSVVVEVKFSEWTADGRLRQPIYLGTRDDKDAREVGREPESLQRRSRTIAAARERVPDRREESARTGAAMPRSTTRRHAAARRQQPADAAQSKRSGAPASGDVVDALERIEREGGDGTLRIARGATLEVSSLDKVFFPSDGYTKGDIMRYYAGVAPLIVSTMADRPLVLKRFPNGIKGKFFFQHNAPDDVPAGVRTEEIENEEGERVLRFVGGNLATLLYTVQLGSIAVDPWHVRVRALEYPDYTTLDLDPGPRATFGRVVEVACWIKEELDALGLRGALKTSGASGLHIYIPLPPRTPEETALLVAQIVATRVANAHPREATIERTVKQRPPAAVYLDYLQNIRGKTLAGPYCVRARAGATVSTPLAWDELTSELDPHHFTITSVPARLAKVGDLWATAMAEKNSRGALYDLLHAPERRHS